MVKAIGGLMEAIGKTAGERGVIGIALSCRGEELIRRDNYVDN